jgi:predicted nucleic acid-binding Zn ribbon protein
MAAPRKRKTEKRRETIHEELMHEWLGCDDPLNLNENISTASDWVEQILRKQFFAESLNEEEVKSAWKDIAGDFIGAHTEPVSVKEGHLSLRVTQPAMRFHLEQMKGDLLRKIQGHFGKNKIKSIKFTLG